ncbi:hypothetical protein AVEN_15196-1 [Araneus ventricosus]|uniref:Uncharacterized protein n=1 Tax=Araneus ventricosus TaxID=182803 RepID=A0A4Y2MSY2_ARAVE|nr:hypothetical protein AVEN_15196-1 [Araneus ventricosus]
MLEYGAVTLAILISSVNSAPMIRNGEYIVPNDTAQCANDLIDWCQGMTYPKQGAGISMISVTISEPSGMVRFFCASDSDGTNCTKNRSPWIACSSDNQLSYKGKPITKDSSDGTDEGICKAADMAFNNLFIQNLAVDNTTLSEEVQKGMEMMFKQLAIVKEQMEAMTKWFNNLFRPGYPYDFDDPMSPGDTSSPQGKNQIEREEKKR